MRAPRPHKSRGAKARTQMRLRRGCHPDHAGLQGGIETAIRDVATYNLDFFMEKPRIQKNLEPEF